MTAMKTSQILTGMMMMMVMMKMGIMMNMTMFNLPENLWYLDLQLPHWVWFQPLNLIYIRLPWVLNLNLEYSRVPSAPVLQIKLPTLPLIDLITTVRIDMFIFYWNRFQHFLKNRIMRMIRHLSFRLRIMLQKIRNYQLLL